METEIPGSELIEEEGEYWMK
jgi:hypothetical protein